MKCEKLTDERRRTTSDGKSSLCLWQGELKTLPVQQELLTLQGYLHLPTGLCRIHVAQSLVFCVVFCKSLFVFLSFFVWSLYCVYFGFCLHIWCLQAFLIVNSMQRYHDLWFILEINPVAPSLQCYCQNLLTTTL